MKESRFYIDHGMIHDRVTGRHVTTNETMYCYEEDGITKTNKPIYRQADIIDCCSLLNYLANNQAKPLEESGCIHCNPIKRNKILGDPRDSVTIEFKPPSAVGEKGEA